MSIFRRNLNIRDQSVSFRLGQQNGYSGDRGFIDHSSHIEGYDQKEYDKGYKYGKRRKKKQNRNHRYNRYSDIFEATLVGFLTILIVLLHIVLVAAPFILVLLAAKLLGIL